MPAVRGGHWMIDHKIFKLFDHKDFWIYPQMHLKVFPIHYSFMALSNFLPLVAVNRVYSGGWQLKWSWSCARRVLVVHNPSQDPMFPPLVMTTQDLCPWGHFLSSKLHLFWNVLDVNYLLFGNGTSPWLTCFFFCHTICWGCSLC